MTTRKHFPAPRAASLPQELKRAVRTALRLVPFGIGSALEFQIFDRVQAKEMERIREFVESLAKDLKRLLDEAPRSVRREMFEWIDSDAFRFILRKILTQVARDHREEKQKAFRSILINSMTKDPRIEFDRKAFFVEILDSLTSEHLQILKHLYDRKIRAGLKDLEYVSDIWKTFAANDEATKNYLYSGLDTLANRQLIVVGPIALRRSPGPSSAKSLDFQLIDKSWQSYGVSQLGIEFVIFVTLPAERHQQG